MKLRTNLATRPFYNTRAVHAATVPERHIVLHQFDRGDLSAHR